MNIFPIDFIGRAVEASTQDFSILVPHHDHFDSIKLQSLLQHVLLVAHDGQVRVHHQNVEAYGVSRTVVQLVGVFLIKPHYLDYPPVFASEYCWHVAFIDVLAINHDEVFPNFLVVAQHCESRIDVNTFVTVFNWVHSHFPFISFFHEFPEFLVASFTSRI